MAWLKPGGLFITDVRGKAGSTIYRKSIPGPMVADSLEEDVPVPGRQHRRGPESKCNCAAFKLADTTYTEMTETEKQVWRDAVKKNARTGYTVWMSEAMHLYQQGLYGPDVPSPSGGYSPALAIPGTKYAPPYQCIKDPVPKPWPNGYYIVQLEIDTPNEPPGWQWRFGASNMVPGLDVYGSMLYYCPVSGWGNTVPPKTAGVLIETDTLSVSTNPIATRWGMYDTRLAAQRFELSPVVETNLIKVTFFLSSDAGVDPNGVPTAKLFSIVNPMSSPASAGAVELMSVELPALGDITPTVATVSFRQYV